ncbi:iron (metal) dependent repressor, DtxR family [Corynebacterium uterequi]|uniref:Diphtheria toxin repressor n=2 Tax=Corynebacterium uterequi TaxID=1072256 RepID=A0A0G3HAS9_9CORY|nr:iron (metal) dependent repressor, DtxR family [Corynebacterium uterequi]
MREITHRVDQKASTATEAIKRLDAAGLVTHIPYTGVSLTDAGRVLAVQMVRRHRLAESLLVTVMGYTWDEVHDDAEILEHAMSDIFIDRVDSLLGYPTRDPHGDPIPRADGVTEPLSQVTLAEVGHQEVTVEQVSDLDPEVLRTLFDVGVVPGARVAVRSRDGDTCSLAVNGADVVVPAHILQEIRVIP